MKLLRNFIKNIIKEIVFKDLYKFFCIKCEIFSKSVPYGIHNNCLPPPVRNKYCKNCYMEIIHHFAKDRFSKNVLDVFEEQLK